MLQWAATRWCCLSYYSQRFLSLLGSLHSCNLFHQVFPTDSPFLWFNQVLFKITFFTFYFFIFVLCWASFPNLSWWIHSYTPSPFIGRLSLCRILQRKLFFLSDWVKRKRCWRNIAQCNTKTDRAGRTSKTKTWTRVILYSRMHCCSEIFPPLRLCSILKNHWRILQTCPSPPKKENIFDQQGIKLLNHVQAHTLFCFCPVFKIDLFIFETRENAETPEHSPTGHIQARGDLLFTQAFISSLSVSPYVWELRCSCSAVDVYKWVAPKPSDSNTSPLTGTPQRKPAIEQESMCVCKHFCLLLLCLAILTDRLRV